MSEISPATLDFIRWAVGTLSVAVFFCACWVARIHFTVADHGREIPAIKTRLKEGEDASAKTQIDLAKLPSRDELERMLDRLYDRLRPSPRSRAKAP